MSWNGNQKKEPRKSGNFERPKGNLDDFFVVPRGVY